MTDTVHTGVHAGLRPTIEGLAGRARVDWRIGLLAAVGLAAAAGLATSWLIPRGPSTALQGLVVMATGLLIGATAGLLVGRRAAIVPVGLVHLASIELGRLDAVGPSLDTVNLGNTFGILGFVVGRGLHGFLLLVPMVFGAALAVHLGRRTAERTANARHHRPFGTAVLGLAATGLLVLVAWPASTPPVLGPDGRPVPGSIAEMATVHLGGVDQTVLIRAADQDKPVLLYLSGGPGQTDFAYSRPVTSGWVQDFVFVDWDQRGNGTSYRGFEPAETLTLDQAVADTIALTDYLRERFDESKIYVMGESWGTILGALAVEQRPDLYHAFIGSGQMVNIRETDTRIYEDLVAYAAGSGNAELATTLEGFGPPPYRDFPWTNGAIWGYYDYIFEPYTPSQPYIDRIDAAGVGPYGVLASEYSFIDKFNVLRGLLDTFAVLYPQVYDVDLRRDAARLEVPVWMLDGTAELDGRRDLALDWFDRLEAPTKELVAYDGAAHSVAFEQIDVVHRLLVETIVPATYQR